MKPPSSVKETLKLALPYFEYRTEKERSPKQLINGDVSNRSEAIVVDKLVPDEDCNKDSSVMIETALT
jgi:hypothetical protein